jgi:microcystin-dependent protein
MTDVEAPALLPTLAMPQLVATGGTYPQRGQAGPPQFYQGMVQPFAALGLEACGALPAQGQILAIPQAQDLFSIYATTFGGNGIMTFALPDLRGRSAIGGDPGMMTGQSLTLTYIIATETNAQQQAPLIGTVALFGGNYAPPGWLVANGMLLPIEAYAPLMEVIGTTFGGNGTQTFALPKLTGCAAVGAGKAPGLPPVALGQQVPGAVPGLGLNYLICTNGYYPPSSGNGGFPPTEPFISQVIAYGGQAPPPDWAYCDGSLLKVAQYEPLYSLIGTTYGGDGIQEFALPDLRGRMLVGS